MDVRRLAGVTCLLAGLLVAAPAQGQGAAATCAGVPATIAGTTGDDELTGAAGDDVIAALDGNDVVDVGVNTVLRGDGHNSPDTIDYSASTTGVVVDLVGGFATGGGSGGDDLVMNAWDQYEYDPRRDGTQDDHFDGGTGDDYLDSAGGTDVLLGGDRKDHLRRTAVRPRWTAAPDATCSRSTSARAGRGPEGL